VVCPYYEKGFCMLGNDCKFEHEQKKICMDYFYGFCPNGPKCQFAHVKSSISISDMSL
jgi:cleavage and polyadenylation specificity factor subunit 4